MQTLLCRIHVLLRPYTRVYSIASTRSIPSHSKTLSAIDQLEQDGARILRTVQTRVEERDDLVACSLDDMSSPEDINVQTGQGTGAAENRLGRMASKSTGALGLCVHILLMRFVNHSSSSAKPFRFWMIWTQQCEL